MSDTSLLDRRLAEIDERLRALQAGLDATDDPTPDEPLGYEAQAVPPSRPAPRSIEPSVTEPPPPTPLRAAIAPVAPDLGADPDRMLGRLHALGEAHERLLELHRELLSQYAELLQRRIAETPPLPIVAGPFADGAALRTFERDLGALPGVGEVTVREFLSGDRVAIEVRLAGR